jgi:hypothetical protein
MLLIALQGAQFACVGGPQIRLFRLKRCARSPHGLPETANQTVARIWMRGRPRPEASLLAVRPHQAGRCAVRNQQRRSSELGRRSAAGGREQRIGECAMVALLGRRIGREQFAQPRRVVETTCSSCWGLRAAERLRSLHAEGSRALSRQAHGSWETNSCSAASCTTSCRDAEAAVSQSARWRPQIANTRNSRARNRRRGGENIAYWRCCCHHN